MSAKKLQKPRRPTGNDEAVKDTRAIPTVGAGATTDRGVTAESHGSEAKLPEPLPRSATNMAPGIPAGSGEGIDKALGQPDSEIGGGVAGDTTVGLDGGEARDPNDVRNEDKGRTTL